MEFCKEKNKLNRKKNGALFGLTSHKYFCMSLRGATHKARLLVQRLQTSCLSKAGFKKDMKNGGQIQIQKNGKKTNERQI